MAHPAIGYTLSTILLNVTVITPGIPCSDITNLNSTVIQLPSHIQLATLPAGYVAHPDVGAAYKIHMEMVTWNTAKELCISEGAHLAVIDTFLKFEFVMNQAGSPCPLWVGIHRMYDGTKWVSATTGSTLTALPWVRETNRSIIRRMPEDDCVQTGTGFYPARGLLPYSCFLRFHYACEIPIPYRLSTILRNVITSGIPGSNIINLNSTVIESRSHIQLATLPAGYISHPVIGVAYNIHSEQVTWKVARERCISEGAHLAVIDTFQKLQFVTNQAGVPFRIWVGIHRMYDDTEWVSATTGSTLTALPWIPRHGPNDRDHCVTRMTLSWLDNQSVDGLATSRCNLSHHYICEIPIPGN